MADAPDAAAPPAAPASREATVNINIGVLGHVDSGKTSLVRALSTMLSTAALDKHPQSKARGITLDLGFSAFTVPAPEHIAAQGGPEELQFTLVDCPGHASLIRTIIGGAQIIDRMILVVDITKGIQTQTAECLVIGEILTDDLLVVLNKVDLLPEAERAQRIEKVTAAVAQALATTRFKGCPILSAAAMVGGDGKAGVGENAATAAATDEPASAVAPQTSGLDALVDVLRATTKLPDRGDVSAQPLYFAIDHCFPIKGQGTVLTGTVLSGCVEVGQTVELPALKEERKVKSIQMFKRSVQRAGKGDRAAMCVSNLNAKLLERGVASTPGSMPATHGVIALVRKVRFFSQECRSRSKVHLTVGHATVMATVTFFGSEQLREVAAAAAGKSLPADAAFEDDQEYLLDEALRGGGKAKGGPFLHWALLELEQPVVCQEGSTVIGSRLNMEVDTKECRIAFYGRTVRRFTKPLDEAELRALRVYKLKQREGVVDRVVDKKPDADGKVRSVVGRGMFAKDADLERFIGKTVVTEDGSRGRLESSFGKTGKFNAHFPDGAALAKGSKLLLPFRHMVFASKEENKKIRQV